MPCCRQASWCSAFLQVLKQRREFLKTWYAVPRKLLRVTFGCITSKSLVLFRPLREPCLQGFFYASKPSTPSNVVRSTRAGSLLVKFKTVFVASGSYNNTVAFRNGFCLQQASTAL